jgi:hypothetical protein
MLITRRKAVLTTLFGTGLIGLRSLVTGLSTGFILNPRQALADSDAGASCTPGTNSKAQYIIFATSGAGDPILQNAPGTYDNYNPMAGSTTVGPPVHPDPTATPGWSNTGQFKSSLNGKTYGCAGAWSDLVTAYPWLASRMQFFHMMTNIQIHPQEPNALKLNGFSSNGDMLPSLLAAQLQPMLCTIQAQPISVGATSPTEAISYHGTPQPIIPPTALKATLVAPTTGALSNLAKLRNLRNQTLNQLVFPMYKDAGSPAQKAFIDSMTNSESDLVKAVQSQAVASLSAIADDTANSQLQAAIILFQLNITPVVAVHLDFGSDNHFDTSLSTEATSTMATLQAPTAQSQGFQGNGGPLGNFVDYLNNASNTINGTAAKDMVTLMTLNVFGRTFVVNSPTSLATSGRNHNFQYQGSLVIGKGFNGGVIGGLAGAQFFGQYDYGAASIDPTSGAPGGSIESVDTACAFAQTMIQGVGGDPSVVAIGGAAKSGPNQTGQVVTAALAT